MEQNCPNVIPSATSHDCYPCCQWEYDEDFEMFFLIFDCVDENNEGLVCVEPSRLPEMDLQAKGLRFCDSGVTSAELLARSVQSQASGKSATIETEAKPFLLALPQGGRKYKFGGRFSSEPKKPKQWLLRHGKWLVQQLWVEGSVDPISHDPGPDKITLTVFPDPRGEPRRYSIPTVEGEREKFVVEYQYYNWKFRFINLGATLG